MDKIIIELEKLISRDPHINYQIISHSRLKTIFLSQGFHRTHTFYIRDNEEDKDIKEVLKSLTFI